MSDKCEIDSLHGQIALGFLIVQDLVVVLAMIVLSAIGIGASGNAGMGRILIALLSGIALVMLVYLLVKYAADSLTDSGAHS